MSMDAKKVEIFQEPHRRWNLSVDLRLRWRIVATEGAQSQLPRAESAQSLLPEWGARRRTPRRRTRKTRRHNRVSTDNVQLTFLNLVANIIARHLPSITVSRVNRFLKYTIQRNFVKSLFVHSTWLRPSYHSHPLAIFPSSSPVVPSCFSVFYSISPISSAFFLYLFYFLFSLLSSSSFIFFYFGSIFVGVYHGQPAVL